MFTLSSLLCGIAPSLPAACSSASCRASAAADCSRCEQAILADTFPPEKRGMAFALYGITVVIAPVIGPTLGGWITDNFSWRWIFFINVPVGLIRSFLTVAHGGGSAASRAAATKEGLKIDYVGLALIALGIAALQMVLDKGQRDDWFESSFISESLRSSPACACW